MRKKFGISLTAVALASSLIASTSMAKENNGHAYGKIDLVGLGDSITAGYGVGSNNAFPNLIGSDEQLDVRNLGISGLTSEKLLTAIRSDKNFRQSIKHADYITLDIGSNDLLAPILPILEAFKKDGTLVQFNPDVLRAQVGVQAGKFALNLPLIIEEIEALTDAPIVVYNIYNPIPLLQNNDELQYLLTMKGYNPIQITAIGHYLLGLHTFADSLLSSVNYGIGSVVNKYSNQGGNVYLADAYGTFSGQPGYILPFDIHPTVEGQEALAHIGAEKFSFDMD